MVFTPKIVRIGRFRAAIYCSETRNMELAIGAGYRKGPGAAAGDAPLQPPPTQGAHGRAAYTVRAPAYSNIESLESE